MCALFGTVSTVVYYMRGCSHRKGSDAEGPENKLINMYYSLGKILFKLRHIPV
jgi:hypothetical protein